MNWVRKLFGLKSPIEKKKEKLASLREKAFQAQRNGDLRMAGKYLHEAEILETSIIEGGEQPDERCLLESDYQRYDPAVIEAYTSFVADPVGFCWGFFHVGGDSMIGVLFVLLCGLFVIRTTEFNSESW